jgi:hypothetical protein
MATKQIDGISDVTSTSTDNNSGTIKANGSVGGTFETSPTTTEKTGVFGSTVVDNDDADKALSIGSFAFNNERPIAKKTTTSLAGVPENFLQSGACVPGLIKSIHKTESVRTRKLTTAIRENKWNEFSGEFDAGYPQVSLDTFYNIAADDTSTLPIDDAANPTRLNPGELVYKDGSPNPINNTYKPKTS